MNSKLVLIENDFRCEIVVRTEYQQLRTLATVMQDGARSEKVARRKRCMRGVRHAARGTRRARRRASGRGPRACAQCRAAHEHARPSDAAFTFVNASCLTDLYVFRTSKIEIRESKKNYTHESHDYSNKFITRERSDGLELSGKPGRTAPGFTYYIIYYYRELCCE